MTRVLLTCLLFGAAGSAPGAIVWWAGQEIPIPTTFEGVAVDLQTGITATSAAGLPGGDANFLLGGGGVTNDADQAATVPTWQPLRTGSGNSDPIRTLTAGETVDGGSSSFATGFGGSDTHFPPFASGVSGYLGFSLVLDNNDEVYGWMRVTLKDDNSTGGFIHEWAYEDSGGPIEVGAVPEPGSLMLAMLGLGVIALRRKR